MKLQDSLMCVGIEKNGERKEWAKEMSNKARESPLAKQLIN